MPALGDTDAALPLVLSLCPSLLWDQVSFGLSDVSLTCCALSCLPVPAPEKVL